MSLLVFQAKFDKGAAKKYQNAEMKFSKLIQEKSSSYKIYCGRHVLYTPYNSLIGQVQYLTDYLRHFFQYNETKFTKK